MSEQLSRIIEHARGRRRVLFLDYDGTLVPFADTPDRAAPDPALLDLLVALGRREDTVVHVVTGRSRDSIEAWLGHLPLGLHAEHGFWSRPHRETEWSARARPDRDWYEQAQVFMKASAIAAPGSFVEEKTSCLAWHYRLASPEAAAAGGALLRVLLQPLMVRHDLEVLSGECVIELRQRGVHKGRVVREILEREGHETFIAAIGDDVTDDDMFLALPAGAFAIAAGERPASAHLRVAGHEPVRELLRRLCDMPLSCTRVRAASEAPAAGAP